MILLPSVRHVTPVPGCRGTPFRLFVYSLIGEEQLRDGW